MFRAAPRLIARSALPRSAAPTRRYISTAPPARKSRSWKNSFLRLGVAGTLIYYYNTTDVFAEEPREYIQSLPEAESETEHLPTIEAISAERQKRKAVQAHLELEKQKEAENAQLNGAPADTAGGMEGIEEEAGQQGAFNPETGEINWDCPCLGGMADGPCGDEFKAAFSCFVYSTEEPKGMDCIDKFKDMQNCFRKYPEVYGSELDSDADDEEDVTGDVAVADTQSSLPTESESPATPTSKSESKPETTATPEKATLSGERSAKPQAEEKTSKPRGVPNLVPDNYKPDAKSD